LHAASAGLEPQELIGHRMRFKANVAANRDRHQRDLQVTAAPSDGTVVCIGLRRAFDVERLRRWPNVFDPDCRTVHD